MIVETKRPFLIALLLIFFPLRRRRSPPQPEAPPRLGWRAGPLMLRNHGARNRGLADCLQLSRRVANLTQPCASVGPARRLQGGRMRSWTSCAALFASSVGIAITGPPVSAADRKPMLLEAVTRCRTIIDPAQRVACYDRSVEALQAAEARNEVTIVDRAQVRETKRSLFGLTLPRLSIFGKDDGGIEISQIDSAIASATIDRGGWVFRLADGSTWRQIDDTEIGRRPRPGDKVTVKRAALGSFRMTVASSPGMKVRREG